MMNLLRLMLIGLTFSLATAFAQMHNGDFEQWNKDSETGVFLPSDWTSLSFIGCLEEDAIGRQLNTEPYQGKHAISINTQYEGITGAPMSGWLFNGGYYYDHDQVRILKGSPITERPELVSFAYRFASDFQDQQGEVKVEIFAGNTVLGSAEYHLSYTGSRWQEINLYIQYEDEELQPNRILIQFFSNSQSGEYEVPVKEATLSIDQVSLEYLAPKPCEDLFAVAYDAKALALHISYNSCENYFIGCSTGWCGMGEFVDNIIYDTSTPAHLEVLDLQGKVRLKARLDTDNIKTILQTVRLEPGVYIARVLGEDIEKRIHQRAQVKFIVGQ